MSNSFDCTIRPALTSDKEALYKLEKAVYAVAWSEAMIAEVLEEAHGTALLALDPAGAVVGGSLGRVVESEFELYKLSVHRAFRRRHIGRQLLAATLAAARDRGARQAFLEVRKSNQAAVALYEAAGFTIMSIRPHYYEDTGDDALIMNRTLSA
ncbi:MAG: ribosomal protein S18-alanine N-acetyltransferase [Chitinivibrionales bacterium]|nr:ribosomal protein S18-alanine N-acetyltransferase [Chitinivibrionales bacterium]